MNIKLQNVSKNFISLRGTVPAVNDITLEIKDKEFFVLLGPSGCGKSTLLNLIAGLEKPNNGEILFDDKPVYSASKNIFTTPKDRNVAMVFQSYALYPHLNVFDNIAFPLKISRMSGPEISKAVNQAAGILEISNLLMAKPAELSGGQRQRVAIARAIVRQPSAFLLDEPLSNLDAQLRASTRSELKNLQRNLNITTIYVTHDQVEAMSLGDRIAVLKDGIVVQTGTPDDLYNNPINTFVATFIGSPPMNLLKTNYTEENGVYFIFIGNKKIKMPAEKNHLFKNLKSYECVFGIRPEHILINPSSEENIFKAKVNTVEPLGRETLLNTSIDNNRLNILTNYIAIKVGDLITIGVELQKAHIFEIDK